MLHLVLRTASHPAALRKGYYRENGTLAARIRHRDWQRAAMTRRMQPTRSIAILVYQGGSSNGA
jgi:hypothetical protein